MIIGIRIDAPEGDVYTPKAFADQVGKVVPAYLPDGSEDLGTVRATEVAADGSHVILDIELAGVAVPPNVD